MMFFMRVEIRESVDEASESSERRAEAVRQISAAVDELGWSKLGSDRNQLAEVRYLNGTPLVIIHGSSNHDSGTSAKLVELLRSIGRIASGSYGFAWYLDDEVTYEWVVHTLIRGEVTQRSDPWFSPLIPTVEDADPMSIDH